MGVILGAQGEQMPLQYIFFSIWLPRKLIPMSTPSTALVYGRSLAGIWGSNPAVAIDVCLLWVLCCQLEVSASTDPSSRGVLSSVVCLSVISIPQQGGGPGPSRAVCVIRKKYPWSNLSPPHHNVLSHVMPMCLTQTRTELHLDTYITEGFVGLTDSHFEHRYESRWLQMLEWLPLEPFM
jgi:hypothetical protein